MNRYALEGISTDFASGAQIGVFVAPYNTVTTVISQLREFMDDRSISLDFPNATIHHESGGTVRLYTESVQLRGRTFDVFVLPHGNAAEFAGIYLHGTEIIEY